jgi:hypothetical protein
MVMGLAGLAFAARLNTAQKKEVEKSAISR